MARSKIGSGDYTYEVIRDFFKSPDGEPFGLISRVAADDEDRIYVFQRRDPPVVVFDRNGKHLASWGTGDVTDPHGLKVIGDTVYTTDRSDSVAKSFTLDGKVKLALGTAGQHSDTGKVDNWLVERAAGPFNHPTEMVKHPVNGDIYISDGYRNARVHRFSPEGKLKASWGSPGKGPGQFHLPHSIAFDDDGNLLIADRSNRRIQIMTPEGEYKGEWTGMGGPNDIVRGKDGNYYIAEQEYDDKPAYICVRDPKGNVLTRIESRHVHGCGVDSQGDVYAGMTVDRGVDKFVRIR